MATELTKQSNKITADGDYFFSVKKDLPCVVSVNFTTPGSAGTIAIKDTDGVQYIDSSGSAISVAYNHVAGVTENRFDILPTGGHINFTAASFASSPVAEVKVTQRQQFS